MSDNIKILLQAGVNPNSQKSLEEDIRKMSEKIKETIKVKLEIDAKDIQIITKQIDEQRKKIKINTVTKDSLFINDKVEQQAFNEITSRLREVKKNVDELAQVKTKYSLDAQGKNKLESATLTYYNKELGQTVNETMKWTESTRTLNGEIQKIRTFRTISLDVSDNMSKATQNAEKFSQSLKDNEAKLTKMKNTAEAVNAVVQKYRGHGLHEESQGLLGNISGIKGNTDEDIRNAEVYLSKMKDIEKQAKSTGKNALSLGEKFKTAFEIYPIWLAATTVIMQTIRGFQASIQYIHDFDDAVVELTKVVDLSNSQINDMKDSAISLGKELGKSSVDIMKAYAEFGRQFKDTEDIKAVTKSAVLASNVTSLSAADAAKILTTAMIDYNMQAKDSIVIVDSLNEIQNNYRINAEDLASSIGKVGSAAKLAGTSMQSLEGITTAIVSATGISGDEAGTAIKGFISRIFRLGSEGEEDAGKSEALLKSLGIEIRKSATEFKNFDDILKEINSNWNSWGSITKQNVAQTIGS